MKKEDINNMFCKLNIMPSQLPTYTNPNDFAKGIKKFSILENVSVSYSSNSCQNIYKKKGE